MGLWNKSLEEILERYNAKLEGNYPRHVASAFFAVSYDDSPPASEIGPPYPWPRDEEEIVTEAIESFAQRWGGLSDEIFLRALHETQGRDHLVALFALGYNTAFPAEEVLSPFWRVRTCWNAVRWPLYWDYGMMSVPYPFWKNTCLPMFLSLRFHHTSLPSVVGVFNRKQRYGLAAIANGLLG